MYTSFGTTCQNTNLVTTSRFPKEYGTHHWAFYLIYNWKDIEERRFSGELLKNSQYDISLKHLSGSFSLIAKNNIHCLMRVCAEFI